MPDNPPDNSEASSAPSDLSRLEQYAATNEKVNLRYLEQSIVDRYKQDTQLKKSIAAW